MEEERYDIAFHEFETPLGQFPDELQSSMVRGSEMVCDGTPNLDILLSKFLNNDELNDIEIQQLNEQERMAIERLKNRRSKAKKRPDQYQKLFFRRAFKYAERVYFGKKGKNKSRKMSNFYHHHFEAIATKMGVPLVNFYHPDKKTKPGLRTGQKSFNLSYIKLLLKSDSFREVIRNYHNKFRQECLAERRLKIPKFLSYIRNAISQHGAHPEQIEQMFKSSKFKVPWTNQEIEEACLRAGEELEKGHLQTSGKGGDEEEHIFSKQCQLGVSEDESGESGESEEE